jgi:carboxymethylenebutenolidase
VATDFKGYLQSEFIEDFEEGLLTRSQALKLLSGVTGSVAAAGLLLAECAQPESTTVPRASVSSGRGLSSQAGGAITAGDLEFPGETATLTAYHARPSIEDRRPAVLVCHENRGLTEHIKDVTRRLASAGYVALAVDLLSRIGGTNSVSDPAEVPGILGNTPPEQFVSDFVSAWRWLQEQDYVLTEGVGMVGFCFGGGVTWRVAIGLPDVRAAVPFYGPHPDPSEVGAIQAAMLAIYAGNDQRINQGIPPIELAMQAAGKTYEKIIYPGVDHAFHNDTGPRYNAEAATDAWAHALDWLNRYLG